MEHVPIRHDYQFVILRADGTREVRPWRDNLFLSAGMDYLAGFQSTAPASAMNFASVGTGPNGTTSYGILALEGSVGSRVAMAARDAALNVLTEVVTFAGFVTGITSLVLREIGIFNAAVTGGTMRSRGVFSSITLADSDFLAVSYRTTVGSHG